MAEFRFIHAADLHLDSPFKGLNGLPDDKRKEIEQSTFAALDELTQLAVTEKVDFVLFSGDIYDVRDRSLRAQLKFQGALERLTSEQIEVYVIHGNHDPLDGKRARLDWPEGVHFFRGDVVETKLAHNRAGEPVATIEGISYPTAEVRESLVPLFLNRSSKQLQEQARTIDRLYRIGMLHTNVDGDPAHDNYAPASLEALVSAEIDYWALGHIHSHRILHRDPWVVYSGATQGRHIKEAGPKGCCLVSVNGKQTFVRFHALDKLRWRHLSVSIEDLENDQDLLNRALAAVKQAKDEAEGRNVMLRLTWVGRGKMHRRLKSDSFISEMLDHLREEAESLSLGGHWVWPESLHVRTASMIPYESLREEEHFLGDLLHLSDQLFADEKQLEAFVEEALEPLITHRKIGKHVRDALLKNKTDLLLRAREQALDLLFEAEEGG